MLIIYPIDYYYPDFFTREKNYLKSKTGVELGFETDAKEYYGLIKEKKDDNTVDVLLFTVNNGVIKYKDLYFITDDIEELLNDQSPFYVENRRNEYTGQIPGFRRGDDMFTSSSKENTIGILTKEKNKKSYKIFPYEHNKLYSRDYVVLDSINIPSKDMIKRIEEIPEKLEISEIRDGNSYGFEDKLKDQIFALNTPLRTIVILLFFPLYLIFVFIAYIQPGYQKFKKLIRRMKLKKKIKKREKKQEEFMKKFLDPEYFKYADKPKKLKEIRSKKRKKYAVEDVFLDKDIWKYNNIEQAKISMYIDVERDNQDNFYFVASFPSIVYKSDKNLKTILHLKLYDITREPIEPVKYTDKYRKASLLSDRPYKVYVHNKLDLSESLGLKNNNSISSLKDFKIPIESIATKSGGIRKYRLIAVLESEEGLFRTSVDFKFKFPKIKNNGGK